MDITRLRREYPVNELRRSILKDLPEDQLKIWLNDAIKAELIEPNAMILSTASKLAKPSSRTVLLKGLNQDGLIFYTDYKSRKGAEIEENPFASVTFLWIPLVRQVVVEGRIEKISKGDSQKYFSTRPRDSQLSAIASKQGEVIASREELNHKWEEIQDRFKGEEVPLPENWGGYRLIPDYFEFWQGRERRLHDRFRYLKEDNSWVIERLSP